MFAPDITVPALREMHRRFGDRIYGRYGFADAFHPTDGWVNPDAIGIDLGITLLSAENLRSARVWEWFMQNPEIVGALDRAGVGRLSSWAQPDGSARRPKKERREENTLQVRDVLEEADMRSGSVTGALVVAGAAAFLVLLAGASSVRAVSFAERFTAFAVDIGVPGRGSAGPVEFVIERYTSDADRDRLMTALFEKGPERLLETLQDLPRVGYLRTPNSIGYDIRYARKMPGEDGGEVITLATDRYISFWEATNRPRTIDYPFTLVEIRIGPDGKGEGKMSLATKITGDKKSRMITLEDYKSQPVLLNNVRKESGQP